MSRVCFGAALLVCVAALAEDKRKPEDGVLARARAEYGQRKYADAVRDLTAALDKHGQDPDFYRLRADCYMNLLQWANALEDYDRVIALGYEHASVYRARASALARLGQLDRAID